MGVCLCGYMYKSVVVCVYVCDSLYKSLKTSSIEPQYETEQLAWSKDSHFVVCLTPVPPHQK